eukprot:scaffold5682_cov140-Cylindrotheca_fusiformis.AAC.8
MEPEKSEPKENDDTPEPTDRDVKFGDDSHPGTMLLKDLVLLHYALRGKESKEEPTEEKDVAELAGRLTELMLHGKKYELSGLKDVPKPFLKGKGRCFEKKDDEWKELDEEQTKSQVAKTILSRFKTLSRLKTIQGKDSVAQDVLDTFGEQFHAKADSGTDSNGKPPHHSAPRPCDVLFLPTEFPWEENMAYEHQTGNKHLLYLASQNVVVDTKEASERVQIAFKLLSSKVDVSSGTEMVQETPRYILQQFVDNQNSWKDMEVTDLAEFATIFVFEVYLEKQIHGTPAAVQSNSSSDMVKPSSEPLEDPTVHDVLFGRGGMTNGHPGNRRFRDVIALHRPDYIRATKMDKPKVARRIVRAIRQGNPPGRFLKKSGDGKWYDVGDRCAAEKTSQGLRERSNAEKRQRSALREALRIRREDLPEDGSQAPQKKQKTTENGGTYAASVPLSLSLKDSQKGEKVSASKKESEDGEDSGETLPPNAVDKDGNILVTDHDILCGRGGLTNHHKGNKRFRDIVALHRPDYVRAPKIQKPSVARVIVRAIRNGDPPGRFLKKDSKTGLWYDIGDKRAAEKTSQALREKTVEEKGKSEDGDDNPTPVLPKKENGEEEASNSKDANGGEEASKSKDANGEKTDQDGKYTTSDGEKTRINANEIVEEKVSTEANIEVPEQKVAVAEV